MNIRFLVFAAAVLTCLVGGLASLCVHPRVSVPVEPFSTTPQPAAHRTLIITPTVNASEPVRSADEWLQQATNAAAGSPEQALAIGRKLLAEDPTDEKGHALVLLAALCDAGQFQTALGLAGEASPELRTGWLNHIFIRWAQSRPQEALKNLDTIADPQLHSTAFRALADGWNSSSPSALATYAVSLAASDDRDYALGAAMDNWSLQDPAGLATWLNTLPPGVEYDAGATMMIEKTDGANRTPELAMKWVECITDPALKQQSLVHVFTEWKQTDSAAAQQYVANATWLSPEQQAALLKDTTVQN